MTEIGRVLLVGAGVIAGTHAAAAQRLPSAPRILAADPSTAARDAFGSTFPDADLLASADELLAERAKPGDVVVVATPPFTHARFVREALESGRHVLCEKPLAMNVDEAADIAAMAEQRGLLLGCCSCRFLGLPTAAHVRDVVTSGGVGDAYRLTFVNRVQRRRSGVEYQPASTWFLDRSKSGGGVLMDWGPYDFASLDELLEPLSVDVLHAFTAKPRTAIDRSPPAVDDVEQHVAATLVYHLADGSSIPVTYERSACAHGEERTVVELEGTDGAVSWDWLMLRRDGVVRQAVDAGGTVQVEETIHAHDGLVDFLDKPLVFFAGRLAGRDTPIRVNRDAAFVFSCLRAVYECAETGRPVHIVRRERA